MNRSGKPDGPRPAGRAPADHGSAARRSAVPQWLIFAITVTGILNNTLIGPSIPDILAELVEARRGGDVPQSCVLVGFAAETGDASASVLDHGRAKLVRKGCDLLVVNEVGRDKTFGQDQNAGWILDSSGAESRVEHGSKDFLAARILDAVVAHSR